MLRKNIYGFTGKLLGFILKEEGAPEQVVMETGKFSNLLHLEGKDFISLHWKHARENEARLITQAKQRAQRDNPEFFTVDARDLSSTVLGYAVTRAKTGSSVEVSIGGSMTVGVAAKPIDLGSPVMLNGDGRFEPAGGMLQPSAAAKRYYDWKSRDYYDGWLESRLELMDEQRAESLRLSKLEFESLESRVGCSCHIAEPCSLCTHEGHPLSLSQMVLDEKELGPVDDVFSGKDGMLTAVDPPDTPTARIEDELPDHVKALMHAHRLIDR